MCSSQQCLIFYQLVFLGFLFLFESWVVTLKLWEARRIKQSKAPQWRHSTSARCPFSISFYFILCYFILFFWATGIQSGREDHLQRERRTFFLLLESFFVNCLLTQIHSFPFILSTYNFNFISKSIGQKFSMSVSPQIIELFT